MLSSKKKLLYFLYIFYFFMIPYLANSTELENFINLENPSLENFNELNSEQKLIYLNEYADFTNPYVNDLAWNYFTTEKISDKNKIGFENFLISEDFSIKEIDGNLNNIKINIDGYISDGNRKISIHDFKNDKPLGKKYSISIINSEIMITTRNGNNYFFEGNLKDDGNGNLALDEGKILGYKIIDGKGIVLDDTVEIKGYFKYFEGIEFFDSSYIKISLEHSLFSPKIILDNAIIKRVSPTSQFYVAGSMFIPDHLFNEIRGNLILKRGDLLNINEIKINSKDLRISNENKILKLGDNDVDVINLQKILVQLGYLEENYELQNGEIRSNIDGIFGRITENALKQFQKDNNLIVDGIYGAKTESSFNKLNLYINVINDPINQDFINQDIYLFFNREGNKNKNFISFSDKIEINGFGFDTEIPNSYFFKSLIEDSNIKINPKGGGVILSKKHDSRLGIDIRGDNDLTINNKDYFIRNDVLYRDLKIALTQNKGISYDLSLKDIYGNKLDYFMDIEGPSAFETLIHYYENGVEPRGYFTAMFKTDIHVRSILFDNHFTAESLYQDRAIISNTYLEPEILNQMQSFVKTLPKDMNPYERFNQIVKKAGEITDYNPEGSVRVISVFGINYKDLADTPSRGFGNAQTVNGRSSQQYKQHLPGWSHGEDKRYRLVTIAGQYLFTPDYVGKSTTIGLRHTSYEILAYLGNKAIVFKDPDRKPKFGTEGPKEDTKADWAAIKFGRNLYNDPKNTLKNFNIYNYLDVPEEEKYVGEISQID